MSAPRSFSVTFPQLSFRELERYTASISVQGLRVDRVFVPEASAHPEGYFKKEWVLELSSSTQSAQLYFSVRSAQAGIVLLPPKTLKPARQATRSGFDLALAKRIEGLRIQSMATVPQERIVRLTFPHDLELVLVLIPIRPEAVLLEAGTLVASTRPTARNEGDPTFTPPTPRTLSDEQLRKIPFREEWIRSPESYARLWLQARDSAALALRAQRLETALRSRLESFERKKHSLEEQHQQSLKEPDWNAYGTLLQTHFYTKPTARDGFYELMDYEKNALVRILADPKLNLKQQLERFFHQAKRNRARLEETATRIQSLQEKISATEAALQALATAAGSTQIEELEKAQGLGTKNAPTNREQKRVAGFSGKQYTSREGLPILVGRNAGENLELTFKVARGNDLWLHVKGRPGAHVAILLPPKKTASLDTLLDAAQLCLLHSGGKDWGKTEVDYTFRKHVKKIKNQTEVSYTHNKTLVVTVDEERLKRLYENT